jgi:PiT family inorganic phosphate transporter
MLGGVGIVIGLATFGIRVISTVGKKITQLTPSRGFAAELAAATTIVIASGTGMPTCPSRRRTPSLARCSA